MPFNGLVFYPLDPFYEFFFFPPRQRQINFLFSCDEIGAVITVACLGKTSAIDETGKCVDEGLHIKRVGNLKVYGAAVQTREHDSVSFDCSPQDDDGQWTKKIDTDVSERG